MATIAFFSVEKQTLKDRHKYSFKAINDCFMQVANLSKFVYAYVINCLSPLCKTLLRHTIKELKLLIWRIKALLTVNPVMN